MAVCNTHSFGSLLDIGLLVLTISEKILFERKIIPCHESVVEPEFRGLPVTIWHHFFKKKNWLRLGVLFWATFSCWLPKFQYGTRPLSHHQISFWELKVWNGNGDRRKFPAKVNRIHRILVIIELDLVIRPARRELHITNWAHLRFCPFLQRWGHTFSGDSFVFFL